MDKQSESLLQLDDRDRLLLDLLQVTSWISNAVREHVTFVSVSHLRSPHPQSFSQDWERDFEGLLFSSSPNLGRRGWGMRANAVSAKVTCSHAELDLQLNLTLPGVQKRLKKLEEKGFIDRYVTLCIVRCWS
jgi:hypothetical protein